MAPEIWSVRDRIFCHFGPFITPLMTQKVKQGKNRKKTHGAGIFPSTFLQPKNGSKKLNLDLN